VNNLRYRVIAIGDYYHWTDRKTGQAVPYENGDEARFNSLDEAVDAFIQGKLAVKKNEVMEGERR
jgi:hypothetical protein